MQDACLVTILRLLAEVDDAQVKAGLENVAQLEKKAGKYIRKVRLDAEGDMAPSHR